MPNRIDQYIETARRLWADEVNQRKRVFSDQRQRIVEHYNRRGLIPSGLLDGDILEHARQELRERGLLAAAVFERVLKDTTIPLGDTEREAVAESLRLWLSGQADDLAQGVQGVNRLGDPGRPRPEYAQLGLHSIEGRVNTEIDLIFMAHSSALGRD